MHKENKITFHQYKETMIVTPFTILLAKYVIHLALSKCMCCLDYATAKIRWIFMTGKRMLTLYLCLMPLQQDTYSTIEPKRKSMGLCFGVARVHTPNEVALR